MNKDSRKVTHKVPCLRFKMTEITVSRVDDARSSLGLTQRWEGFEMQDIVDWLTPDIRTIYISLGVCSSPMEVYVRKFKPVSGDVTCVHWRDGNTRKKVDIEPYALASIHDSAKDVISYIYDNAVKGLATFAENGRMSRITRETYHWAIQHYNSLRVRTLVRSYYLILLTSVSGPRA